MIHRLKLILAVLATVSLFPFGARADIFNENGDAGGTIGTASPTGIIGSFGDPLTAITGTISSGGDVDIFIIAITNTTLFSATTNNGGTLGSLDTALFLFNSSGAPVYANDDAPGGLSLQSTLPAGNSFISVLSPGIYFLAISLSGNNPVNSSNQLLFTTSADTTAVRGPAAGLNPNTLSNFNGLTSFPQSGSYQIDIASLSTNVIPEPSTWIFLAMGAMTLSLVQARRRGLTFATIKAQGSRRAFRLLGIFGAFTTALTLVAKPIPDNIGNGLDKLVESNLLMRAVRQTNPMARKGAMPNIVTYQGTDGKLYATEQAAIFASMALGDGKGRLLVRINPTGQTDLDSLFKLLSLRAPSFAVTAIDQKYRGVGVFNAYISVDDVAVVAGTAGVRSVILELRPRHNKSLQATRDGKPNPNVVPGQVIPQLGTYTDQGVFQHRVDTINQFYNPSAPLNLNGAGMSIACISNSFAANAAHPASLDVTNNDLPGNASNPLGNTTPVFVLQDDLGSTTSDDEGRGMCQIVYKMAPMAKVGFATADTGEVGFANNIRGLAGMPGFTAPGQTFAADVICDDVGYFDEPFFQDGIIGAGVDDVAAFGVSYFSSAANDIGVNGYDSDLRWVANGSGLTSATNSALVGTNINLANVPTNYYAGGFHNFNPAGLDVAQLVNIASNASEPLTVLQWNEPYDQNTAPNYTGTVFSTTGTYVATDLVYTVTATLTTGTLYELQESAINGSTFDGIITIKDPNGNVVIGPQDTGTDETVRFFAPVTGANYTITVGHFSTTVGDFSLEMQSASGFTSPGVVTKIRLLAFTTAGVYVPSSSLTVDTSATNQPIQLGATLRSGGGTQLQYVICRENVPNSPVAATRIRYLIPGNGVGGIGPAEYFSYDTATTGGHAMARGCNGTAAYSVFRPNVPESFTSPGPAVIYYDQNQNRLAVPEVRLQPRVAAADAANISLNEGQAGLGSDSGSDFDTVGNFSGTSAAAPHAAACALLVLQAHGGSRSVTPAQMTSVLQRSTYPHDLDPHFSSGSARATNGGKVTVTFASDNSTNLGTGMNDANSLAINYIGSSFIQSIVFNPTGTAAAAGNPTGGNNGLDVSSAYFTNTYPGMVWAPATKAFTVGSASNLLAADVSAAFTNLAPLPSNGTTQAWTMTLNFPNNNFTSGKVLTFTVGRAVQHSATVTGVAGTGPTGGTTSANYNADLFGGGVSIPEGVVTPGGMTFTGTLGDGSTFSGTIVNTIGSGYSKLDGWGFINAQAAVNAPLN